MLFLDSMKTQIRPSQALDQTLLFDQLHLNARTPVLFLLAQKHTLELNCYLLTALWHRQQLPGLGEPSHPPRGGYSQAYPQCPLSLLLPHLLMQCLRRPLAPPLLLLHLLLYPLNTVWYQNFMRTWTRHSQKCL